MENVITLRAVDWFRRSTHWLVTHDAVGGGRGQVNLSQVHPETLDGQVELADVVVLLLSHIFQTTLQKDKGEPLGTSVVGVLHLPTLDMNKTSSVVDVYGKFHNNILQRLVFQRDINREL